MITTIRTVGIQHPARAVEEPLRQIVTNAGGDASVVLNAVAEGKGNYGYNAASGEYGDMIECRYPRSDQGHTVRAAKRCISVRPVADNRSNGCRSTAGRCWRCPGNAGYGWHGWHGRHDVSQAPRQARITGKQKGLALRGLFFSIAATACPGLPHWKVRRSNGRSWFFARC